MTRKEEISGLIAGWVGGASSVALTHPLDTIKVRLQVLTHYKGVWDCTKKIFIDEGSRSFYKGMAFPLVTFSVYNSFIFASYQFFQKEICRWRYDDFRACPSLTDQFVAAMATGACSVSIGAPVDLIKISLQMQTDAKKFPKLKKKSSMPKLKHIPEYHRVEIAKKMHSFSHTPHYSGPLNCARDIYRRNGIRGLYRGAGIMLIRDIPGYAIYLVPYFTLRDHLNRNASENNIVWALVASALAGGCAGVLSWGGIHAIDTVKSRIQADSHNGKRKYEGYIHCVKTIYQENGIRGFFRGIVLNTLRGFPQSAVLFLGIEGVHQAIDKLDWIVDHKTTHP